MKRTMITALLLLSLTTPVFAFSDTADSKWNKEIDALSEINVVSGYGNDTFQPKGTLTRAEAAMFAANTLGSYGEMMLGSVQDADSLFPDIKNDYFAMNQINLLSMLDIVSGYEDGNFRPENAVTYAELVKMCIGLTGYGNLVSKTENWVSGYVQTGNEYGFFDGLEVTDETANTAVSREDTAKIIYNTLHMPLCKDTAYDINGGSVRTIMDGTNGTELMTCFTEYFTSPEPSADGDK